MPNIGKRISDTYYVMKFSNFQSLFKAFDVFPSLISDGLLSRAYVDALQNPLLVSGTLPATGDKGDPTHCKINLTLRDHTGLLYTQFVEGFVRVAMTVFSSAHTQNALFNNTAPEKVAALMKWMNKQIQLGSIQGRLRPSTTSPDRFSKKCKLFKTDIK
ncbi:hypothetical protein ADEAN_000935400 [Angomonas deanei]|uniref:Uncharacterized protein n=1 Tax=Angomonas deanei TaxID=59799 RepID=A0A7G2CR11_9TRYP|nr:hypothetical protein ADEAN_000935400 [Angomonas deanei]